MAWEQSRNQPWASADEEEAVLAYLQAHPDLLQRHPELLPRLVPPMADHGAGVYDFQYFLLQRLRAELGRQAAEQQRLLATSRASQALLRRVHAAALVLLEAGTGDQLAQTIATDLPLLLGVDLACLLLERDRSLSGSLPGSLPGGLRRVAPGSVARWLGRRQLLVCAPDRGAPEIFADGAGLVQAAVLVRLTFSDQAPPGLLALGSRHHDWFHPGQGTEPLSFLARVIERVTCDCLDLGA